MISKDELKEENEHISHILPFGKYKLKLQGEFILYQSEDMKTNADMITNEYFCVAIENIYLSGCSANHYGGTSNS